MSDHLHLERPGLITVEIHAVDEDTIASTANAMARLWPTSGTPRVWRIPGEPGVRGRLYADITRDPDDAGLPHPPDNSRTGAVSSSTTPPLGPSPAAPSGGADW